jgi:hypothetical protein
MIKLQTKKSNYKTFQGKKNNIKFDWKKNSNRIKLERKYFLKPFQIK